MVVHKVTCFTVAKSNQSILYQLISTVLNSSIDMSLKYYFEVYSLRNCEQNCLAISV